jgi:hypothetical protein
VGSLSRRSALFARSPRMAVRPSVLAKSIALGEFHHWLALAGTRVGLSSGILSFIRPPSCPPWLHGHYPLRSYYGDSDSCPALSSTQTGLLDYRVCISRHSVSNHPMRPRLPAMLLVPGGLGPRFAFCRYRRFFGLRSLLAVSSVAYGRIEFVSRAVLARQFYGLSFRFQLLSTPRRRDAVTFNSWREAPPQRDFHPPMHAHSQAHERRFLIGLNCD